MVPTLVLASNSPRRRQLLSLAGWSFDVRPVEVDESPLPGEDPARYVLRLAESKALVAARQLRPGEVILAADTTVADGAQILGKPADRTEAFHMLRALKGRSHMVYTGIAACSADAATLRSDLCSTQVWMRDYSDPEIASYIDSGDPFDKAGAYAIQNPAFHPVERIEGCYGCVMGLSVCHAVRLLRAFGFVPPNEEADRCLETERLGDSRACVAYQDRLDSAPREDLNQGKET